MRVVVIAALLACAMTALCVAEEEADVKKAAEEVKAAEAPREEDQEMQMGETPRRAANDYSHPDVKVTAMIPDYLGKEIPAGEEVEMIVWFANANNAPIRLHGIFAALQSSMDASRFIQNVCHTHTHIHVLQSLFSVLFLSPLFLSLTMNDNSSLLAP